MPVFFSEESPHTCERCALWCGRTGSVREETFAFWLAARFHKESIYYPNSELSSSMCGISTNAGIRHIFGFLNPVFPANHLTHLRMSWCLMTLMLPMLLFRAVLHVLLLGVSCCRTKTLRRLRCKTSSTISTSRNGMYIHMRLALSPDTFPSSNVLRYRQDEILRHQIMLGAHISV